MVITEGEKEERVGGIKVRHKERKGYREGGLASDSMQHVRHLLPSQ